MCTVCLPSCSVVTCTPTSTCDAASRSCYCTLFTWCDVLHLQELKAEGRSDRDIYDELRTMYWAPNTSGQPLDAAAMEGHTHGEGASVSVATTPVPQSVEPTSSDPTTLHPNTASSPPVDRSVASSPAAPLLPKDERLRTIEATSALEAAAPITCTEAPGGVPGARPSEQQTAPAAPAEQR